MPPLRCLIVALALAAAPLCAVAQEAATALMAPPVAGEIYIENVAPQPLTFGLAPDNQSWERFELGAGQVAVFAGGPQWYVLVLTEGVELRYRLDDGGSYRLYWNEAEQRWDMMTCEQPACGRAQAAP